MGALGNEYPEFRIISPFAGVAILLACSINSSFFMVSLPYYW